MSKNKVTLNGVEYKITMNFATIMQYYMETGGKEITDYSQGDDLAENVAHIAHATLYANNKDKRDTIPTAEEIFESDELDFITMNTAVVNLFTEWTAKNKDPKQKPEKEDDEPKNE